MNISKLKNNINNPKRQQIYLGLLSLFVASFPITYNLNAQALIALVIFFLVDSKSNLKEKLQVGIKNKLVLIMAAYFFIQIIGLFFTEDVRRGINYSIRSLPFLVLPIVIVSENLSKNNAKKLLNFIKIWMLLVMVYLVAYQYFIELRSIGSTVHFAFAKIGISQHHISLMLVVAIMISAHQLLHQSKKLWNAIVLILLFCFLLLLSSRSSLLILIISAIVLLSRYYKKTSKIKKVIVVSSGICFGILAFYGSPELKRKAEMFIKSTDIDIEIVKTKNSITFVKNTIEQRIMINLASITIITDNPIFGVGTGDYLDALLTEYHKLGFIAGIKEQFNAHNQYLEDYLKVGIVGFIGCLSLMLVLIKHGCQNKSLLFYCAFGTLFICLFESLFARHHGVAFVAFFVPLFFKVEQILDSRTLN